MKNGPFDPAHLNESVFAVPPLARSDSFEVSVDENAKIIAHLESGGIRSILYGGNAVFYHIALSEYARTLEIIADAAGQDTVIVPSIGPAFGFALDQVEVLRDFDFGTVMLLPSRDVIDQQGIASGLRQLSDRLGMPIVLYLKIDQWLDASLIRSLEDDGVISWIKYAVVREDPSKDDYLRSVIDCFPSSRIVSGIGEQPAIIHLRDFGVTGFTSGCVCVAPARSMEMLRAIQAGNIELAEEIRRWFLPLEDLRNEISPIRVLHHAVSEAGIAEAGPLQPFLSQLAQDQISEIGKAAKGLLPRPA